MRLEGSYNLKKELLFEEKIFYFKAYNEITLQNVFSITIYPRLK